MPLPEPKPEQMRYLKGKAANTVRDPRTQKKVESETRPNAKCPCGSGKKYKHCCMWL